MNCKKFIELSKEWKHQVCIFGAGDFGSNIGYEIIKEAGFNIAFYCDNNAFGGKRHGLDICKPDSLTNKVDHVLFIVAVFGTAGEDIVKQLLNMGAKHVFHLAVGNPEWELAQYLDETGDEDLNNRFPCIMDDEIYLKRRFRLRMNRDLDLKNPKSFNEKLQWLKINDRKQIYTTMVDKHAVKRFVADRIGEEYIIPTIGVWDSFDDVDFSSLPNSFVLKCTHDSGSILICKNKNKFNYIEAKKKLESSLKRNYFWPDREWPYYNVPRRILAEEYIQGKGDMLDVYKVFNFMGEPKLIQVIQDDKTENETIDYFDIDWNLLDLRQNFPNSLNHLSKPGKLKEILELARILSNGIASVRTDFYCVNDKVIFSEFTFFSDSGCERFYPESWDEKLGRLIQLPK